MSYSIKALRGIPDDQLIAEHDDIALSTGVGVDYYLKELDRRDRARGEEVALRLARTTNRLAVISAVVSVLALGVAVVTLLTTG